MNIDGMTCLIGLIGWPVSHSLSPALHNAAAAALGINWIYVPLPVHPDRLSDALNGLPALGFRGVNVTVPFKETVLPYLNAVYPVAQTIGAVNTIAVSDRLLTGFNTDWSGFLADLESFNFIVDGRECLVMGAGGSARSIAYALGNAGARVTIVARKIDQAGALATRLRAALANTQIRTARWDQAAALAAGFFRPLIVNTTPLGMAGSRVNDSPWPEGAPFPDKAFVYDLVYNPAPTRFLQQAAAAGCRTANGLGMLVEQAAEAFEIWTGRRPDTEVMRQAVGS
ncbi:MAG: shikimate dehydrogenase [Chloroflexota bacterium]|jgi:shikimate dehydrogenase